MVNKLYAIRSWFQRLSCIYIIKIKPDETLLSIINIYSEQIDPNIKRDLTQRKRDLFQIIEEELKKNYPE